MRRDDWESALSEYLTAHQSIVFEWGWSDCALFAVGGYEAMSGIDFGEPYRGKYTTRKGAAKALREIGKGTLEATLDDLFGEIPLSSARRGDIVMHQGASGICYGSYAFFIEEENGLTTVPLSQCTKAFSTWGK